MSPDDHRPGGQPPGDLYETDFFLWTQAQADALRAEGAQRAVGAVDWARVADEVQDMGRRDLRECFSRTITIIEHLLKLAWTRRKAPKSGWRNTIRTQRRELILALTPTIRRSVEETLEGLHADALRDAELAFRDDEPGAPRDTSLRWSLPQILGEADDPIR